MSTGEIMLITAVVVSSFWAGVIAIVVLVQSYREDDVTEEIRSLVERLANTPPDPSASSYGRHHLRRQ